MIAVEEPNKAEAVVALNDRGGMIALTEVGRL